LEVLMKRSTKTRPPVSPKQLAANRANATLSTGPRTPQGKADSSQNARRHGFTATTSAVVRLEDIQEVATRRPDILADFRPANPQESFARERLAVAQQTILRAESFHRITRQSNSWTLFLRYQAQTERLYRRALEEFTRVGGPRDEIPNKRAVLDPNSKKPKPLISHSVEPNPFPKRPRPTTTHRTAPADRFTPVLHPFDPVSHPLTE
jgi:hypothetical protein